jgi:nucleotide-binding universal stress UspA family protein
MYAKILVALDGSEYSRAGGDITLTLAHHLGAKILATHIYDARIHSTRLQEMEPVLPPQYQEEQELKRRRKTHKKLISEGFGSLSEGYMDEFLTKAQQQSIPVSQVHRQGRNYIELIKLATEQKVNLLVLGAHGLGTVKDGHMGSTALRVLRSAPCDLLIVRRAQRKGPILVGIDGSQEALSAMQKATVWSRIQKKPLELAAAYDPYFHNHIFQTMSSSLSPERQKEVNLSSQKSLHEEIIDDGLGKLYRNFLDHAGEECKKMKMKTKTILLSGKAYRSLLDYSEKIHADLVVIGRYGHHRNNNVQIGSTSEAVTQLTSTNVLVTEPLASPLFSSKQKTHSLEWKEEALDYLQRIPSFAQPMARQSIERYVESKGGKQVTLKDVQEVSRTLGMDKKDNPDS